MDTRQALEQEENMGIPEVTKQSNNLKKSEDKQINMQCKNFNCVLHFQHISVFVIILNYYFHSLFAQTKVKINWMNA